MPPQHGKSELCSRRMPAKILGDDPNKRIAVVAYNHTFSSKFNRDIQRVIDSKEYRELYPETTLSGRNVRSDAKGSWLRNNDEFEIVGKKGSLISVGVGGGLTGNKVDVAIIDDPYKDAQQANSEAYKRQLFEWWDSVLETRLHNDSQICLTFTRWRHDDIAGRLLKLEKEGKTGQKWFVVKFPALKEGGKNSYDKRRIGQALWPKHLTAAKLKERKAKNPTAFEALYQQNPTPKTGNVIKIDQLKTYELNQLPEGVNHCYIDTATSEKELKNNDPSGILIYRIHKNKIYLIEFIKGLWAMPDLLEKIKWVHTRHLTGRRSTIYIENKSNGRSVKQFLDKETRFSVVLENIKGGKLERAENEAPTIEAGRVLYPIGEYWVDSFLKQLAGFPLLAHDEEVDCLTGSIRTGLKSGKFQLL